MKNSIGIFTDNILDNSQIIKEIKNFLLSDNPFSDFVVFTPDLIKSYDTETSILIDYYMLFYKGLIIFLSVDDFLIYKDKIIGKPCVFLQNIPNNIDKSQLKNCMILTITDNQMELIDYYGL
jgi:hypothetical protein